MFLPLNPSTKADKLGYILGHCRARALVAEGRLMPVVAEALADAQDLALIVVSGDPPANLPSIRPAMLAFGRAASGEASPPRHGGIDLDLAMLIYTSGSTGRPKGVMMTHANVAAASGSILTYLGTTAEDTIVNVLPLAFDYGLYQLIMAVTVGATLVLERSFAFPQALFETIRRDEVTVFPMVPTIAATILAMRDLEAGFLPSLRTITNTAAALPVDHIERLRALFPAARLFSMYGLTECKRCTYLPPEDLDLRPGSVGIAIPNTEAFVLDDSGALAAPGVIGELHIRGPHVMQGYWDNAAASAAALVPGRYPHERMLRTGDLFYADAEGYLYFVGRKDDIIKSRGEKVAPKEVEAVLHRCPGIVEAVVFGRPDPILGEAVQAVVVASDPELDEQAVLRHCRRHLEEVMVPRTVAFRRSLPKTDTGKVSRRLAAEAFETEPEPIS